MRPSIRPGDRRIALAGRDRNAELRTSLEINDVRIAPTSAINFSFGSRSSRARENSTRSRIETTTSASARRSTSDRIARGFAITGDLMLLNQTVAIETIDEF